MSRVFTIGLLMLFINFGEAVASERPNIILFLVDDMGWMDSSVYGSQYYETPNMEQLARRGMTFTDAYAMPLCSPTRASILTGKHSARHGITTASGHVPPKPKDAALYPENAAPGKKMIYARSRNFLDPAEYTLAEALRDSGYRTAHIGKWHLGLTEPHWPDKHGFDVSFHGKPDPGPASYFSPYGFRQYQSFPDGPPGEYITDRVTDEALQFIESNRDRPFYLNLWHYGVHGPWGHKEAYTKRFSQKEDPRGQQGNPIMASMLQSIDESLGRLVAKLEELKLSEKTIVIFYSDNGGNTHSNTSNDRKTANLRPNHPRFSMIQDWRKWAGGQPPTNNSPLRDGKGRLYEGGIRVPLIVVWPGTVEANTRSSDLVGCIDMYPTVLEMAGVSKPVDQKIDGLSFVSVLKQDGHLQRDALVTWFPHLVPGVAVRQEYWKLIKRFEPTDEYPDGFELFNLKEDLGESRNLASSMPEKVKELSKLIDTFVTDTKAAVPKPNPLFRAQAASARPLLGWVPKGCEAKIVDGTLAISAKGKSPFIAMTGLRAPGPVKLTLRVKSDFAGKCRVQWRTVDQDTFVAGQSVEYQLSHSADWQDITIELPVKGTLLHFRLGVPATDGICEIAKITLHSDSSHRLHTWDFATAQ